jgi:hypothetical protein
MLTEEVLKNVCKLGQGEQCCRYIVSGKSGLTCAKLNPSVRAAIDGAAHRMKAKGDNCDGKS